MSAPVGSSPPASPLSPERLGSLSPTVEVETPELVVFSYTLAGIGSRIAAALIDGLICFVTILLVGIFVSSMPRPGAQGKASSTDAWVAAIFGITIFVVLWGYYVLFEGLSDGQTPGKKVLRLRVVRDGGFSVSLGESAVRNLVRFIDMQPAFVPLVGLTSMFVTRSGKRLGDLAAGTMVVREDLMRTAPSHVAPTPVAADEAPTEPAPLQTVLREEEYDILDAFMRRRADLTAQARDALVAQLTARLAQSLAENPALDIGGRTPIARLVRLHEMERAARERGASSRHERGAAREKNVLIATRAPRWSQFAARLAFAQRFGVNALGETGVRQFVEEYRDLTGDLARLRTAARGRTTPELFYLSRLVAGAHNLLYRAPSFTIARALRFVAIDAPTEVRRSWRPILLAAVALFGPAIIAYTAVVRDPAVAGTFIPAAMLDRAEEGVRRARLGTGYIQDPEVFRPVMASTIIANNVQVTFAVFAFGMTAGVMSLFLLVMNGVSLGGVFGLYVSKGIGTLLLAFVAPHGVLELTAICIAGGAGFLLAAAMLIPGRRTRRRALVENGRRAIRLIAASSVLLLVAGSLEGMVSPIPTWPLSLKLAVSGATAVALVLYLSSGLRTRAVEAPAPETDLLLGL